MFGVSTFGVSTLEVNTFFVSTLKVNIMAPQQRDLNNDTSVAMSFHVAGLC